MYENHKIQGWSHTNLNKINLWKYYRLTKEERDDYNRKVDNALQKEKYRRMPEDPTSRIERRVSNILKQDLPPEATPLYL